VNLTVRRGVFRVDSLLISHRIVGRT